MRAAADWNDPRVMDHFCFEHYVAGALHNLEIVVVAGLLQGRSNIRASQAAGAQRPVFGTVEFVASFSGSRFGVSFASLSGERGYRPFGADDQRGPPVPGNLLLSSVQAILAEVVMNVVRRSGLGRPPLLFIAGEPLRFFLLGGRQLRFGIKFLRAESFGPLQRREAVVGPHSLKVRMSVG